MLQRSENRIRGKAEREIVTGGGEEYNDAGNML
jgi:hypothetical protein